MPSSPIRQVMIAEIGTEFQNDDRKGHRPPNSTGKRRGTLWPLRGLRPDAASDRRGERCRPAARHPSARCGPDFRRVSVARRIPGKGRALLLGGEVGRARTPPAA